MFDRIPNSAACSSGRKAPESSGKGSRPALKCDMEAEENAAK
jgi:hypothetical protein